MNGIKLEVRGKINLKLKITGKLLDGYHTLDTLMASVNIADVITLKKAGATEVFMDGALAEPSNTAVLALKLCQEKFGIGHARVEIEKNIPIAAGLGGSSADAAGVFAAVSRVYDIPISEMFLIAPQIGADVPFMVLGGTAQVKGIGEDVEFVDTLKIHDLVIIKPAGGVTTKDAYKRYDEIGYTQRENTKLQNHLESAAVSLNPEVGEAINVLSEYTAKTIMCGSGSAVCGLFEDEQSAKAALQQIKKNWAGYAVTAKTADRGIVFLEEM